MKITINSGDFGRSSWEELCSATASLGDLEDCPREDTPYKASREAVEQAIEDLKGKIDSVKNGPLCVGDTRAFKAAWVADLRGAITVLKGYLKTAGKRKAATHV